MNVVHNYHLSSMLLLYLRIGSCGAISFLQLIQIFSAFPKEHLQEHLFVFSSHLKELANYIFTKLAQLLCEKKWKTRNIGILDNKVASWVSKFTNVSLGMLFILNDLKFLKFLIFLEDKFQAWHSQMCTKKCILLLNQSIERSSNKSINQLRLGVLVS